MMQKSLHLTKVVALAKAEKNTAKKFIKFSEAPYVFCASASANTKHSI
jgi:hypothetical protein